MALFGLVARPRASLLVTILCLIVVSSVLRYAPFAPYIFTTPRAASTFVDPGVELVVAAVKADNTSWIQDHFPAHPTHIYIADDPTAPLTVKKNIGHESNIYLTYIIDNYHNLPDIVIFIHGRRYQWHNEDPLYDGVTPLKNLQIPYLMKHGFATLRCSWLLGCPLEIKPDLNADVKWDDPDADQRAKTEAVYAVAFTELFPGQPLPVDGVGVHCGAQFAVTRDRILGRTIDEYRAYRSWLWTTELTDEFSGRVMEYSWHQILGQPPIDCPHAGTCFCEKFGMCDLQCEEYGCEKTYFFNFGELPENWPDEGPGTNGWPLRNWTEIEVEPVMEPEEPPPPPFDLDA